MLVEVKVPQLSESVSEATLLEWKKKEGESVSRDENLIDIETDKVVLELPSPADGVLVKVLKNARGSVTSGEVIATIDTEAKPSAEKSDDQSISAAAPAAAGASGGESGGWWAAWSACAECVSGAHSAAHSTAAAGVPARTASTTRLATVCSARLTDRV